MKYKCGQCLQEVKQVRASDDKKQWLCDECYFNEKPDIIKKHGQDTRKH